MAVRAMGLVQDSDTRGDFRRTLSGLLAPTSSLKARSGFVPDGGGVLSSVGGMQMALAPCTVMVQGGSKNDQGVYPVVSTQSETLTFDNGGATNRIDLVVVRIRDNDADASGSYSATVEIVKGSSATTPPAVPTSAVAAYEVTVPAGRTAGNGGLDASAITKDRRVYTTSLGGVTPSSSASDVAGVFEGQMRWRADTGQMEAYTGGAWKPIASADVVSDWVSFTPSGTGFSATGITNRCKYLKRPGLITVIYDWTWPASPSISGDIILSLPINSAVMGNVGSASAEDGSARYWGTPWLSATAIRIYKGNAAQPLTTGDSWNATQPFTWGGGDIFRCVVSYPPA